MDTNLKKSFDSSRALLFGLLVNCIFPTSSEERCPLWDLRNNLTFEMKYDLVMSLSREEINSILMQHEKCYEKRFPGFFQK